MVTAADRVDAAQLGTRSILGSGGQGTVWALDDPTTVYKEYAGEALGSLDVAALEAMVAFPAGLPDWQAASLRARAAWPTAIVQRDGRVTGLLMPRVPQPFHTRIWLTRDYQERLAQVQLLLNDQPYLAARRLAVDDRLRLELLYDVAQTMAQWHELGVVVGDLSPNNLLFSTTSRPRCYFIDCDAMRVGGRSVLPQIETPDWQTPSAGEPTGTTHTDAYKFALLCIRLFAGDQGARDAAVLRAVDPALYALATQAVTVAPADRPGLARWRETLAEALIAPGRSTAALRSPAAPTPTPAASPPGPAASPSGPSTAPAGHPRPVAVTRPARSVRRLVPLVLVAVLLLCAAPTVSSSVGTWWRGTVGAETPTNVSMSPAEQAAQVAELLAVSGRDRKRVVSAIENTIFCRNTSAAADTLGRAADGRQAALDRAEALRTDQLPNGAELKEQMILAFRHSRAADEAYQRWASRVSADGCRSPAMRGKDRTRGDSESRAAGAAKRRVAKLWNPIAESHGHPTVSHLTI
ncbi:hypothetical protein C1I93_11635 [Micromonospora endophytica]|uniref:Uncharacterized protein n=1 Tax=Micromonospora endophytica TaxID=515350 RepID=A0A2W2DK14_9ACTN|nr:hypothetical protein C1I93_11635 [Micromonospora endophytica]RIW45708.1 hypothetical protein D3H59_14850 [Micromonospora endophytica]BCJ62787.1 hypothetical protein Jiend_62090 [Micromonospora endophytica]